MTSTAASGSEPLVGLVTPAYNEEPYLEECVRSILAQTWERWDLTIVNNGSTDRTLEIARDLAAGDPRITVRDNAEHLEQLPNLNQALRFVPDDAEFTKFVLADDLIYPTCLERMVEVAVTSERIGLVCSYIATERRVLGSGLPRNRSVYSGRDVCAHQLLTGHFYFGSPTAQLWRADIVRGRQPFFRTRFHADTDACYDELADWDFGFVHDVLTFRRTENESVTMGHIRFNPVLIDRLVALANYGPRYLEPSALARQWRTVFREYRHFLGRSALMGEGAAFWSHHREGLQTMGVELTAARKARYALGWLLATVLNPHETGRRVLERMRRRGEADPIDPITGLPARPHDG